MPFVFVFVLGLVAGFCLSFAVQSALRQAEAARKARIAREEARAPKSRKK